MEKFVSECNKDVQGAERKSKIVVIELASKYCNFLICIHPFEDGNGRMCRLLMNAILPGTQVQLWR
jgi:Fic family protein